MKQNDKYIVAITGGISTGKSTAINYILMKGYEVVDLDEIGHNVLDLSSVRSVLVTKFGSDILDNTGKIDRKNLGKAVFKNKESLQYLNEVTHPIIYEKAKEAIEKSEDNIVFLEIPLLFETKSGFPEFYEMIDEVWVISCKESIQTSRLMIREKITLEDAQKKIKSQMSLRVKERLGNVIIYNNSDIYNLYEEIGIELKNLEKRVH